MGIKLVKFFKMLILPLLISSTVCGQELDIKKNNKDGKRPEATKTIELDFTDLPDSDKPVSSIEAPPTTNFSAPKATAAPERLSFDKAKIKLTRATVIIKITDNMNLYYIQTGSFIDCTNRLILTSYGVIPNATKIEVATALRHPITKEPVSTLSQYGKSDWHIGEVLLLSGNSNLAILKAEEGIDQSRCTELSTEHARPLNRYETVYSMSHIDNTLFGILSGFSGNRSTYQSYIVNHVPFSLPWDLKERKWIKDFSGLYGSPVIDEFGNLIGVNYGAVRQYLTTTFYASDYSLINEFLDLYHQEYD